jgi:YbgC/YbaW family acyl-CoA thioester hydrolase
MSIEFHTKRKIEFADVDLAGFVHFSRFFVFMESAEHEFLRSLGTSVHTRIQGKEIGWPRLRVSCEYIRPARFEDLLDIHLALVRKGKKSMTYQITFHRDGELIARGEVKSACCVVEPGKGFQAIPIPEFIESALSKLPGRKE